MQKDGVVITELQGNELNSIDRQFSISFVNDAIREMFQFEMSQESLVPEHILSINCFRLSSTTGEVEKCLKDILSN